MKIPNISAEGKERAMTAAIELCRLRGLNPKTVVQIRDPDNPDTYYYGTQAEALLREIIAHAQCTAALQYAYRQWGG